MKKFKHILVCGLAVVASAVAVQAQTLTQDWKMTTGLPAADNARWGVGFDGKVFVNDKTAQKIASFDGTNKNTLEVGAAGVCTSVDSKGNLLVANLWKWGGKMTSLKIWNKATGAISEIEVTIPKGVTSTNRMDVFGKVVGDITSETGGAVFFCPSNGNKIVKLFFANSAQVVEKSKVIETTFANFQTTCIAQPLTNDPESDAIILKDKGVKEAYVFDGTNWTTLADAGINGSTAEGHHWASDDDSYMAESDPETPGVFTFNPIDLKVEGKAVGEEAEEDLAYFAFVTGITITDTEADWGAVNNSRWCPDNKDGVLTDKTDFTDFGKHYNGTFCIKNGAYKLTVDLNTKTVKAVYLTSSGVEQVGVEAAGVIAADGQIRIVGDAATVSVYNAAGQAVAVNSAERTFAVARGMYVVVVDGKATKVVVR